MMPIVTGWYDDDHRVIANNFSGEFTWEEINTALIDLEVLADSVDHGVVMFSDMRGCSMIPKGNAITPAKASMKLLPGNIIQIIIVVDSRLIEVFATMLFDMLPAWRNRVRFTRKYEEGLHFVEAAMISSSVNATRR
jgi:hypothetical protein